MDFFNYAGIHRPVKLYIMPAAINLEDVSITASIDEDQNTAEVTFDLVVSRIFFINWRASEPLSGLFNQESLYIYYSTYAIFTL